MDAAIAGLIDCREARLLDPDWWRRVRLVLAALERQKTLASADAAFRYYLAQMSIAGLAVEGLEKAQTQAIEMYYDILGALRPWEGRSYVVRRQREFRDYRQQFIDVFGVDPMDPAFKAWEAETVQRLAQDDQRATGVEDPEEQLRRRMRERDGIQRS